MIGVVAHRSRAESAHRLREAVGAVYLSMDNGQWGCEANHRRTWEWLAGKPSEWSIVLEDDAIPVDGFAHHAEAALKSAPTGFASLYRGHHVNNVDFEKRGLQATQRAENAGAHWILSDHLLHAVAVAIRTVLLPEMLDHLLMLPDNFPIDEAISHYARTVDTKIAYTAPSLVDHADTESVILRHHRRDKLPRPKGRVAYRVGERVRWNSETVNL